MNTNIPQFAVVRISRNSRTGQSEQKVILESDDESFCYKKALDLQKCVINLEGSPWSLEYCVVEN